MAELLFTLTYYWSVFVVKVNFFDRLDSISFLKPSVFLSPLAAIGSSALLCCGLLIVPDYQLAPAHPWSAALDDGFAVYQVLVDRTLAIVGESVGGKPVVRFDAKSETGRIALAQCCRPSVAAVRPEPPRR